jgi:ribose transport system substrate-binding protein
MLKAPPSIPGRNPIRVIDASNVAETGNPPQFDQGFGDEYPAAYQRLWGLG